MLRTVLTIVQVFASLAIVALVLLQRGRGADAGAGFGAGASGSVFGARGATTGLSRSTAVFAAIFMLNSLALAWLGTRPSETTPRGLIEQPASTGPAAAVPSPAIPESQAPGQVVPGSVAPAPAAGAPLESVPSNAPAQ
ncbi:MAG: preprotein translocase subunit SecG [Gammaproteobacteria bacterium]|nr:preprotein translocase subunit SecG [Gammaproteobacteria bacterium]